MNTMPAGVSVDERKPSLMRFRAKHPGSRGCDSCGKPISANKERCFKCWQEYVAKMSQNELAEVVAGVRTAITDAE